MDFFRWLIDSTLQTILAQIVRPLHVFVPARLPCCRTVKLFRKLPCHIFHQHKRTSCNPSLCAPLFISKFQKGIRSVPELHRFDLLWPKCGPLESAWSWLIAVRSLVYLLTIPLYRAVNSTTLPDLQGESWVTFFHPLPKVCTRCNHCGCGFRPLPGVRKVRFFEIHYINYLQKIFFQFKKYHLFHPFGWNRWNFNVFRGDFFLKKLTLFRQSRTLCNG